MRLSFPHVVTCIFIVMKLMGYIDWSWWLVFSPMIIGFIVLVLYNFTKEMNK